MTEIGNVYGQSLYELARDEALSADLQQQLEVLQQCFSQDQGFLKLLSSPSLSKAERCQVLENSFRDQIHPYILNFLKILTEKGYIRHFSDCCDAYTASYNLDNGILPVTAVTAVPMTEAQQETLKQKLSQITGKQVKLRCRIDASVLGGVRLDYDGRRLDDTLTHRMDAIQGLLAKTVL